MDLGLHVSGGQAPPATGGALRPGPPGPSQGSREAPGLRARTPGHRVKEHIRLPLLPTDTTASSPLSSPAPRLATATDCSLDEAWGLEEQELHRSLGLPVAQTEVGGWAGSSTLWSEELGFRPPLRGPCSARTPGLQGSGRGWPLFPRVSTGGLRTPEGPRGESLSAPSGTPRIAGYWRPPCPLHAALQGPAGQAAGAQPCLARRPGSPSACSGLSLRAMPDSGQGFCEEGHLGRLARLPHTAQAHLGSGGLEIKFSP